MLNSNLTRLRPTCHRKLCILKHAWLFIRLWSHWLSGLFFLPIWKSQFIIDQNLTQFLTETCHNQTSWATPFSKYMHALTWSKGIYCTICNYITTFSMWPQKIDFRFSHTIFSHPVFVHFLIYIGFISYNVQSMILIKFVLFTIVFKTFDRSFCQNYSFFEPRTPEIFV